MTKYSSVLILLLNQFVLGFILDLNSITDLKLFNDYSVIPFHTFVNNKRTRLYGPVDKNKLCFQILTMFPPIVIFIFNNIIVTFLFALYLSLVYNEDSRLLMVYLFSFELGALFSYFFPVSSPFKWQTNEAQRNKILYQATTQKI